jgi:hypothetical protein
MNDQERRCFEAIKHPEPPEDFDDDSGDWMWFDAVERKWVTTRRLDQVRDFLKDVPSDG